MNKLLSILLITLQFVLFAPSILRAQQATEINKNPTAKKSEDESAKKLREDSIDFVRSIGRDAEALNLPENRVSFSMEAAHLLWEFDEKTAREMFQTAKNDVRSLMIEADKIKQAEENPEDESAQTFLVPERLGKARKVSSILRLREQLVMTLAKYDAKSAFDFLIETRLVETVKKSDQIYYYEPPNNEARLEMRLAEIVTRQDTSRALEIALKSIEKSVDNYQLSGLVQKLYAKDAEKGAKLASEIVKKLRFAKLAEEYNSRSVALFLFESGATSLAKKDKPTSGATAPKVSLLSESEMRELAEILITFGLEAKFNEDSRYGIFSALESKMPLLQKYAPASAARLKLKIAQNNKKTQSETATAVPPAISTPTPNIEATRKMREAEAAATAEKEEFERLNKSANSSDSKVSADEFRSSLNKIKSRNAKLLAYTQLAYQLAKSGNLKTAKDLLSDAEQLTVPQARKSTEMLEHLMLIRAFSAVDPDKAFQMTEALIFELNDVIAGFAKVAGFIIEEAIIENGEIDLTGLPSQFLGNGGVGAQLFGGLNEALVNLAKADFQRTSALADKFARSEIRVTAKMIIARSLLPSKNTDTEFDSEDDADSIEEAKGEVRTVEISAPPRAVATPILPKR